MTVLRWIGRRLRQLPAAVGYLAVGGVTAALSMLALVALFVVGGLSLGVVGIPAIPETIRLLRPLLGLERQRAGARLGEPIAGAYQPLSGPLTRQLGTVFRDPANLRDIGWLILHAVVGIPLGLFAVALPLSVLIQVSGAFFWQELPPGSIDNYGFVVDSWTTARLSGLISIPLAMLTLQLPVIARWQALTARTMLGPSEGALAVRVAELTATRAAALDAHGAELRRIERDLHDGAQARIAAVIMQLGLADQLRDRDPAQADTLVRKAQGTAEAALAELRDVVRSVYPPVLADRGLASAVSALAARSPIPCTLDVEWLGPGRRSGRSEGPGTSTQPEEGRRFGMSEEPGADAQPDEGRRFGTSEEARATEQPGDGRRAAVPGSIGRRPAAVEAAAYFVVAEALTNATKHSGAEHVSVTLGGSDERLIVEVRDDGAGAAMETEGGGLAGIRRRAEALDGRMVLSSPDGGPTVVRVELPCGS
ncbi:sensor domain-containing protein [Nocardia sp. NPDC051030]|uniref:sensor histidine kinase n=1 Tax=Nocardia sp. NPDC051030 TaxID=3155162 RepID=UPI003424165A